MKKAHKAKIIAEDAWNIVRNNPDLIVVKLTKIYEVGNSEGKKPGTARTFRPGDSDGVYYDEVPIVYGSPTQGLVGGYFYQGFRNRDPNDYFLILIPANPSTDEVVKKLPIFPSTWRRLGTKEHHAYKVVGTDDNGSSEIRIFNRIKPPIEDWYTGRIVRTRNQYLYSAQSNILTTLNTDTGDTTTCDVGDVISCVDIGSVTNQVHVITHGINEQLVEIGCAEAVELGESDGFNKAFSDWALDLDGELDCEDGWGYAWEDFSYDQLIIDAEGDPGSFYFWELPDDVLFDADENAADCYRLGFLEGARQVYDIGSENAGCGSGAGGFE